MLVDLNSVAVGTSDLGDSLHDHDSSVMNKSVINKKDNTKV